MGLHISNILSLFEYDIKYFCYIFYCHFILFPFFYFPYWNIEVHHKINLYAKICILKII